MNLFSENTAQVSMKFRGGEHFHRQVGFGRNCPSHPVKTLLQYYGKSLEALPGVAYPSFRDNRSTLNTKTGLKKNSGAGYDRKFGLMMMLNWYCYSVNEEALCDHPQS